MPIIIPITLAATLPSANFTFDVPSVVFDSTQDLNQPERRWLIRNDTPLWDFTFRKDGAPLQLDGWAVSLKAYATGLTLFNRSLTVIDAPTGTAQLQLISADGMTAGRYKLQVSLIKDQEASIVDFSDLYVVKDVS